MLKKCEIEKLCREANRVGHKLNKDKTSHQNRPRQAGTTFALNKHRYHKLKQ